MPEYHSHLEYVTLKRFLLAAGPSELPLDPRAQRPPCPLASGDFRRKSGKHWEIILNILCYNKGPLTLL